MSIRKTANNGHLGREKRLELKKKARLEQITARFTWATPKIVEEMLLSTRKHIERFFRRSPGELEAANELFIEHYAMTYEELMLVMMLQAEDRRRREKEEEEDKVYFDFMKVLNEPALALLEGSEILRQLGEDLDR